MIDLLGFFVLLVKLLACIGGVLLFIIGATILMGPPVGAKIIPDNEIRTFRVTVGDYNSHVAFLREHGVDITPNKPKWGPAMHERLVALGVDPDKEVLTAGDISKLCRSLKRSRK